MGSKVEDIMAGVARRKRSGIQHGGSAEGHGGPPSRAAIAVARCAIPCCSVALRTSSVLKRFAPAADAKAAVGM